MAQRCQQTQKPMVALMLEHDCDTLRGSWLGALLTMQRRWIAFHGTDPDGEAGPVFESRVDALVREMEIATRNREGLFACRSPERKAQVPEAVPPSPSGSFGVGDGVHGGSGNAAAELTNAELGSQVRAMVIASLTEKELATVARARGYSLVKVVDLIGARALSCCCRIAMNVAKCHSCACLRVCARVCS
jgi:hypothetical protein